MNLRIVVLAALVTASGCVMTPKPYLRISTAKADDLKAAVDKDETWYEFQPGDVVPFNLVFFGALEGAGEGPSLVRAKQKFYLVARKNMPMQISLDGQTTVGSYALKTIVMVVPKRDGDGGQVAWFTYLGDSRQPELELEKLLESASKPPTTASR